MLPLIAELFAPIISLFIFVLGTGFTFSIMGVILTAKDVPALVIGAMTGVFYAGLVLGSIRIEPFITRVGHIRAYAVFSATLAILYLLQALYYSIWGWLAIRFVAGIATAGLYVVIESWLLYKTSRNNRGQVLSLYMIVFYAAQSLGQFFLKISDPKGGFLFIVSSMLCSLSIIPLSMTRIASPHYSAPSTLKINILLKNASVGLLGSLVAGMVMGAIYAFMPAMLSIKFENYNEVANYMFIIIIGGMILQYPIGKLSDIFDRRKVFIAISVAIIISSLVLLYFPHGPFWMWYIIIGIFGGLTFTIYPISIAYACDALEPADIVAGTQTLLLAYSAGAMIGPLVAPLFIHFAPEHGLFIYLICICTLVLPPFLMQRKPIN